MGKADAKKTSLWMNLRGKEGIHRFGRLFEGPIKWYDAAILLSICIFCFLSYTMRDILHTAGCSYGYLDGHIFDFYDYLAESGISETGSLGLHASYLPTVYILFAIWNIPMKLIGLMPQASAVLGTIPTYWAKILPCLAFVFSGYIVFLIATELRMSSHKAKICMYAYLTMPVCLFGQFILGQYESFIVLSILLGVYFWLKKRTVWFIFWFSVAVTFKYTALILFIPLLVLREKNFWKILLQLICVLGLFALEFLIYFHSEAFRTYAFGIGSSGDNPTGYFMNAAYFTGFEMGTDFRYMVYLSVVAFIFVLGYSYFQKPDNAQAEGKYAMYILCLSAAALFSFSKWHPHWLMIAVPFWTLTAFLHKNTKIFLILDLLFGVLFVMFSVCQFPEVCDEVMLNEGIFKFILPDRTIGTYTTMADYLGKLDMSIELSVLTALIGAYAVFKHPKYMSADPDSSVDKCIGWIRTRYILTALVFIVPSLLCVSGTLNAHASYEENHREILVTMYDGSDLKQPFVSDGTELKKLQFPVSRGELWNEGTLRVSVETEAGETLYIEEVSFTDCREGAFVSLSPNIGLTDGETYVVHFTSEVDGDSSFSLLSTFSESDYKTAFCANLPADYHLDMKIFQ